MKNFNRYIGILAMIILFSCSKEANLKEVIIGKWENEKVQIEITSNEIIFVSNGGEKYNYTFDPKEANLLNEGKVLKFNNKVWYMVFNKEYTSVTFSEHNSNSKIICNKVQEFEKREIAKKETKLIPSSINIDGNLSNEISIVQNAPHSITIINEYQTEVKIKLKVKKGNNATNSDNDEILGSLEFFDSDDVPISGFPTEFDDYEARVKLCSILNSNIDTESWITLKMKGNIEKLPLKLSKFKLSLNIEKNKYGYSSNNDVDNSYTNESGSVSSGSSNFDELIRSYEKYIDQYIVLMKKAKNNDMSALSEYPTMMQKAQDLQTKISRVQGQMSPEQVGRFTSLQTKLIQAAY
jgi:hypothetical protein